MGQRHEALVGVSIMAALLGTTVTVGAETPEPDVRLTLKWCDPHGLFEQGFKGIGRELRRVFDPLAVDLAWQTCSSDDSTAEPTRSHDIQVLLVKSAPSQWGLSTRAMGAVLSQDGPQDQVYIFFDTVARVAGHAPEALRERWPTAREKRDLARAFSRVIAHEVFHAVLPGRPHAAEGITHFELDRASLLGRQVVFDSGVVEAFREAFSRTAEGAATSEP